TGHVDQEEIVNPVLLSGDLMKAFRHQDIPAIDQIFRYGRASKAYKIVSSAAYNFDRPLVLTECYGAIADMPVANLYKEAMDQFAKGINAMVPHAVWYAPASATFPPDLSPENETYGPHLPDYNRYIGRLQRMLQGGRHVADIGILYPIATLQAGTVFGPGKPYEGGVIPPEADYMDVGERLSLSVRRDFTFIHPEILDQKCVADGARIRMRNRVNYEEYRVFIIPGSRAIHASNLRKIRAFYDQGGKVIATTRLPDMSAEFGEDDDVRRAVAEMFGADAGKVSDFPRASASSSWAAGGYDPALAVDGDPETRWNAADGTKGGQWLEVDFGEEKTFERIIIQEAFDRTTAYRIEAWDGSAWSDCARGERIGSRKTETFPPVKASRVRLTIESIASDSVSIREFEIRDAAGRNLACRAAAPIVRVNAAGGKAWFVPSPRADALKAILAEAVPVPDVEVEVAGEDADDLPGGHLSAIHKVKDRRDIYFFANSSDATVDATVRLRGSLVLERWDPHTGEITACAAEILSRDGGQATQVRLHLAPVRSLFLVSRADRTSR
ncbi:MAG: discoidin domain-containing protein, partial [Planctomycetes bacterium]|nr:discoidin domain-containing protein [Planctomycetota bacterium]